jgi:hypothetical protein
MRRRSVDLRVGAHEDHEMNYALLSALLVSPFLHVCIKMITVTKLAVLLSQDVSRLCT